MEGREGTDGKSEEVESETATKYTARETEEKENDVASIEIRRHVN